MNLYKTSSININNRILLQVAEGEAMSLTGNSSILAFNKGSLEYFKNARRTTGLSKIPVNVIPIDMSDDAIEIVADYLSIKTAASVASKDLS